TVRNILDVLIIRSRHGDQTVHETQRLARKRIARISHAHAVHNKRVPIDTGRDRTGGQRPDTVIGTLEVAAVDLLEKLHPISGGENLFCIRRIEADRDALVRYCWRNQRIAWSWLWQILG